MNRKSLRICMAVFLIAMFLCSNLGTLDMQTKPNMLLTARGDYVNANNNTNQNDIEEDPLVPGWCKDARLTNDSADTLHPDITVDSTGSIHIVWQDGRTGLDYGVYYIRSFDGGYSWTEPRLISNLSQGGHNPSITTWGTTIYVAWWSYVETAEKSDIYFRKSLDGGETWGAINRLTDASGNAYNTRVLAQEDVIQMVWSDERDGNFEIYYKRSGDGGDTWSNDIRLTKTNGRSSIPSIAVDLIGDVHIVWKEEIESSMEVYYKKGANHGSDWGESLKIAEATGGWWVQPQVGVDSLGDIHVVWEGGNNTRAIFYKRWIKDNSTWAARQQLAIEGDNPSIALDSSDNVHIIWSDYSDGYVNGSFVGTELRYRKIVNYENMEQEELRLTYAKGWGKHSEIAIDSSNILHVVWIDDRNGNKEIYYKRTLNPVTEPPIIVTQSLNQTTCKPGASITVSGNAVYNNSLIPNANVTIKILETGDEWSTTTDSTGNYSKTITAPHSPGEYTIRVIVTSGNRTGRKQMKLTVEGMDGEQNDRGKFNIFYIVCVGLAAGAIVVTIALSRKKRRTIK